MVNVPAGTAFDFDAIRPMFGGRLTQEQVDGINVICAAWQDHGDGDNRKLAYLLATAKHETTDTMQPIHERGGKAYFNKYNAGTKIGKALGNTEPGDGYLFRGRGYVQLTGRANYAKAGKKLGINLVADPERALEPTLAAAILIKGSLEGWFTGKKLGDFIGSEADYINARRVINGTDRAAHIAGLAVIFAKALGRPVAGQEARPGTPASPEPSLPRSEPANWLAALIDIILSLFRRK